MHSASDDGYRLLSPPYEILAALTMGRLNPAVKERYEAEIDRRAAQLLQRALKKNPERVARKNLTVKDFRHLVPSVPCGTDWWSDPANTKSAVDDKQAATNS
jgi:hypothetical protein